MTVQQRLPTLPRLRHGEEYKTTRRKAKVDEGQSQAKPWPLAALPRYHR